MFNFIQIDKIELFPIKVNFDVAGVISTGKGASTDPYRDGSAAPSELPVPWRDLQPDADVFSLLAWRTAISEFAGRESEMETLKQWANSGPPISAKFMIGEGGAGKTRLAGELAMELRAQGWAAGFPDLRDSKAYLAARAGTLLIVDYPEEHPGGLKSLFTGLARLEQNNCSRIRVLFLSRREADAWRQLAMDTKADASIDWAPVMVGPLKGEAAYSLFHSALERAAEAEGTVPPPVSTEAFDAWLEQAPENDRALFILATAIYCALHPDQPIVDYKGREVVTALVERETTRLRTTSEGVGLDTEALSQLLAFAAIRGGMDRETIDRLANASSLNVKFPAWPDIVEKIGPTSWLTDDGVVTPEPDILAACLVVEVFRRNRAAAPDWLWAAIEDDFTSRLSTLARLSYDAEVILGLREQTLEDIAQGKTDSTLSAWLRDAVAGKPERCEMIESALKDPRLEGGFLPTAVTVWRTLLESTPDQYRQADLWNNLSNHAAMLGNVSEALKASRESVKAIRRLAKSNPARYEPALASSLNSLSIDLSAVGDTHGALDTIREAVEIRRRLASVSPARYEPNLATSLNNLSNHLSDSGDRQGALDAIHEAVEIDRRLASVSPARYEPALAGSLNNLSLRLSDSGDRQGALDAIREALEIDRRLAASSPARYEPALAMSLANLSVDLSAIGDPQGALDAIREAVEIRRRLASASPARYEPDLAMSLSVMSHRLEEQGQTEAAIEATEEALRLMQPYAERYPDSVHGRRYRVMQQDLERLAGGKKPDTSGDSE